MPESTSITMNSPPRRRNLPVLVNSLHSLLSGGSFGVVRLNGSQYTDAADPQGSDHTSLVQLDRNEYTEVR